MNSGSGDNVNVPKTCDLEPICSSSGHSECSSDLMSLEEDKEIASKAVLLVINSARKGAVCLCSNIAELLRDNQRLQKTVEAQRRLIKLLKKTPPALRSHVSPSSQTAPSSSSSSSIVFSTTEDLWSSSSGSAQGERRSPGSITLPPLAGEQRLVDSLARSSPLSKPLEKPTHPAAVASISEVASASVRCPSRSQSQQRRRDCQTAEQEGLRMCQMGAPRPPSTDENVSGQNLKLEEGPSGAEDFTTEEAAEEVGLGSEAEQAGVEASGRAEAPLKDIGGQYAERKKPFLKLGERVVLGRGRKGVVRFIGQLESINSKEIYVGVELDIPCGENDGKTKGKRYFTCRPYHGTFAQMSAVKSCKPLAAAGCTPNGPDTSDSDEGGSSSTDTRNVKRILRRTRNQMNINSPVRCKQPPGANEQTSDQGSRIPPLVDSKGLPKMSPIV